MRRTTEASKSGTKLAYAFVEYVVRSPAVSLRSLIGIGTPWNGASEGDASASRAAVSAPSASTVTNAFSCGSSRSIRSR